MIIGLENKFLSFFEWPLKTGFTVPHCWKSHVVARIITQTATKKVFGQLKRQIMCLLNVLHREIQAAKMLGSILDIYYENINMRCLFLSQNSISNAYKPVYLCSLVIPILSVTIAISTPLLHESSKDSDENGLMLRLN